MLLHSFWHSSSSRTSKSNPTRVPTHRPGAEQITSKEETSKNKLSSKTDSYYQHLMELMQDEKLYTDVELTLQNLSERLGISPGYLSRIINEKESKNFFEFVKLHFVEILHS